MSFRLMTSNLLHERVDIAHFATVLDEYAPDVVVTQELGPGSAEVLAVRYPNHELHPSLDFTGRGIASRFHTDFGSIDMPGRDGTSAHFEVDGAPVRLAGIHLLNPIHFPWWVTARARGLQLDGLFAWIGEGEEPLLVAGDVNASPRWPAYRRLAERLTDLVLEHDPAAERTWSWRPGWPRLLRIDHVFGSGFGATEVSVVEIRGTDHAALIVDLEVIG
ncbi:MAG TPA: endonuclease/exonuclease/phosphatase family protein [Acidimicrobiia bacterium]